MFRLLIKLECCRNIYCIKGRQVIKLNDNKIADKLVRNGSNSISCDFVLVGKRNCMYTKHLQLSKVNLAAITNILTGYCKIRIRSGLKLNSSFQFKKRGKTN